MSRIIDVTLNLKDNFTDKMKKAESSLIQNRRIITQNGRQIAGIIEDVPFTSALNLDPDVAGIVVMEPLDPLWSEYIIKMNNPSKENIRMLDKLCEEEVTESNRHWAIKRYGYYPDIMEKVYEPMKKQTRMVTLFMVIAIMLSALGQIAMSTYYATEHEKEIGIRKVFGGTVESESRRNVLAYMSYCLFASIIAVPLSIWITGRYLETFVYRMQQSPWIYIVAVAALLVISLASVLWQTVRAARTNPAEALKKE
jgi:putative ABC transport system permease protein